MRSRGNALTRSADWLRIFLERRVDAGRYYDLLGDHVLGSGTLANMGYWVGATELAEAVEAMFGVVRDGAALTADAHVVDVGCGFGVNAIECVTRAGAKNVTGLNLSAHQLAYARRLAREQRVERAVQFLQASATDMPFPDASVDAVVSVEAAFHFDSRERFIAEARRVLRPGGRLSLVDIVAPPPRSSWSRLLLSYARRGLHLPASNVYGLAEYRGLLEAAGFEVRVFESIRERVFPPFRRWFFRQPLRSLARYNVAMMLTSAAYFFYPWDYVRVVAVR